MPPKGFLTQKGSQHMDNDIFDLALSVRVKKIPQPAAGRIKFLMVTNTGLGHATAYYYRGDPTALVFRIKENWYERLDIKKY
jgi:hypothetical protein